MTAQPSLIVLCHQGLLSSEPRCTQPLLVLYLGAEPGSEHSSVVATTWPWPIALSCQASPSRREGVAKKTRCGPSHPVTKPVHTMDSRTRSDAFAT
jgi:hypothetical protein